MHLEVDQNDLRRMRAVERSTVPLDPGQARVRVDTFGLTSDNVTYAAYGRSLRYWECFPAPVEGGIIWGRVPVWGFGDVLESTAPDLAPSGRVCGYFPMADELVVEPGRVDDRSFHRRDCPSGGRAGRLQPLPVRRLGSPLPIRERSPTDAPVATVRDVVGRRRLPRRQRPVRRRHGCHLQRFREDGDRCGIPSGRAGRHRGCRTDHCGTPRVRPEPRVLRDHRELRPMPTSA